VRADRLLTEQRRQIHAHRRQMYGSIRVRGTVRERGEHGLRRRTRTTVTDPRATPAAAGVARAFASAAFGGPDRLWLSDGRPPADSAVSVACFLHISRAGAPGRSWPGPGDTRGCVMGILAWIVLGLIAGFLASAVMRGGGYGIVGDVIVGIVGALLGGFLFSLVGGSGVNGLNLYSIIVAFLGACVLIAILRAISGSRTRV
jgi:uncharacterized membrane protein YeaQ/YmgE (transglycosylase-associated protein family)